MPQLGAEPPNPGTLAGRARTGQPIDRRLLVFGLAAVGFISTNAPVW